MGPGGVSGSRPAAFSPRAYNPRSLLQVLKQYRRPDFLHYIRGLNERGYFEQVLPVWAKIKGVKGISDPRFHPPDEPIDHHLLNVAANIAANPDLNRAARPELVLLAGLLHDIGLGIDPARHEAAGTEAIPDILKGFGLSGEELLRIQFIIRQHSVMGDIYFGRTEANEVVKLTGLAHLVQTTSRLVDLYLVSKADTQTVSERGAAAVEKYYLDTKGVLAYGRSPEVSDEDVGLIAALEASGSRAEWQNLPSRYPDSTAVFKIITRGDTDTLWQLALALSQKRINIVRANIFYFANGLYSIKFYVERQTENEQAIAEAMSDFAADRIAEAEITPTAARPYRKTAIAVSNELSDSATAVSITTYDRLFLFYRVAKILSRFGHVHQVLATTANDQVADVFYLTDRAGQKISDPAVLGRISAEIADAIKIE